MKSRFSLIIMFLLLLNLIRCGCPEPVVFSYNWNGMDISYDRYVIHEEGSSTPWPSDDTVFYGATFGLRILMQTQLVAKAECNIDFSNLAIARSKCDPDIYQPKVQITDFNIYTLNDFDDQHPNNSDISDYFFSEQFNEKYYLGYLNNNDLYKLLEHLHLSHLPTKGSVHKFKIEFILSTGTKLIGVTKEITLLPEK